MGTQATGDQGEDVVDQSDSEQENPKARLLAWAIAAALVLAVLAGAYAIVSTSSDDDKADAAKPTTPVVPTAAPVSGTSTSSAVTTAPPATAATVTAPGESTPTTAAAAATTDTTTTTVGATVAPTPTSGTFPATSIPPTGIELVPGLWYGVDQGIVRKRFEEELLSKNACEAMSLLTAIPRIDGSNQSVTSPLLQEYVGAWRTLAGLVASSRVDGVATSSAEIREIFGAAFDLIEDDGFAPSSLSRLSQPISVNGRLVNGLTLQAAVATKHQWVTAHCPSDIQL